jgi:hypothetical protein
MVLFIAALAQSGDFYLNRSGAQGLAIRLIGCREVYASDAHPQLDVETDYLDQQTMCGLLPFTVTKIVMSGVPSIPSAFSTAQLGRFTCKGPLAKFDF